MVRKKSIVWMITTLFLLSMILAGCGSGSGDENSENGKVKLVFWSGATKGNKDQIHEEELIKEYAEKNNIEIDYQLFNWDQLKDKIVTSVAASDAPSITWGLGEWYGEFSNMGALADLSSFWDSYEDKDQFYPNVIDALTTDGKLQALPNYIAPRALVYHSDLLTKAGYNAPPKTWDEMVEMAKTIKDKTGKYAFGIAGTGDRAPQELASFLFQNGLNIADSEGDGKYKNTWQDSSDNLKKATEVFQFYKDMLDNEVIDPNSAVGGWEELDTNFSLGKYAMVNDGSWMQNYEANNPEEMKDVAVGLPPHNSNPSTFLEISTYYIYNNNEREIEESTKLVKYLLNKENQQAGRPEGSPRMDMEIDGNNKWAQGFANPELISQAQPLPPISMAEITRPMQDAIAMVLQNGDSPKDAAKYLSDKINEALKNQEVYAE
ncbi:ABC transporter substrate-binding protein [Niallia sp. JL1B1071]|uniref:ABC transporter substrate-binding protein n=1 Tax=Niallia tiangongensis TaxID=3237105 RepID=UPI0037DCEAF3